MTEQSTLPIGINKLECSIPNLVEYVLIADDGYWLGRFQAWTCGDSAHVERGMYDLFDLLNAARHLAMRTA